MTKPRAFRSTGWTFRATPPRKPTEGPRLPRGRLLLNATGQVRVRTSGGARTAPGPGLVVGSCDELRKLDAIAARAARQGAPVVVRVTDRPIGRAVVGTGPTWLLGQAPGYPLRVRLASGWRNARLVAVKFSGQVRVRLGRKTVDVPWSHVQRR